MPLPAPVTSATFCVIESFNSSPLSDELTTRIVERKDSLTLIHQASSLFFFSLRRRGSLMRRFNVADFEFQSAEFGVVVFSEFVGEVDDAVLLNVHGSDAFGPMPAYGRKGYGSRA